MKLQGKLTVVLLLLVIWFASILDEKGFQMRKWDVPAQPITLYFGQSDAMGVSPEIRWFPNGQVTPRHLIEALIEGPRDPRLVPSLPASTRLLGTQRQGDRIIVNFGQSIQSDHPGGSAGEIMTVYSVVNTLTEIPGVSAVIWLIEGESVETLVGHLDLSRPVTRSEYAIVDP